MKYIGIVNELRSEHKSGFYGRKPLESEDAKEIAKEISDTFQWHDALSIGLNVVAAVPVIGLYARVAAAGASIIPQALKHKNKFLTNNKQKCRLQQEIKNLEARIIILENDSLLNNYNIDKKLLYGLFDDFGNKKSAIKTIFQSKGGSDLHIIERKYLPEKFKHLNKGHFGEGIYAFHPKNENILIPLKNSNILIQNLILEESIRAYESLGAKNIIIKDLTALKANAKTIAKNIEANTELDYSKIILRELSFGKGVFDPERAMMDKYFIQDIPAIMTTIQSRILGNQLSNKFSEKISLSAGLDTNVIDVFSTGAKAQYEKEWSFEVEFYDKNEISSLKAT